MDPVPLDTNTKPPFSRRDMQGIEYILLHVQEPILFVIRKQTRHSPTQVTPVADYYIIAGYVYQAPDLSSLISFRLASGIHHLVSAFDEAQSYMRYHPTKGYSWEFSKDADSKDPLSDKNKDKQKEEPSSAFQRARVDLLLGEICKKFFPKVNETAKPADAKPEQKAAVQNGDAGVERNGTTDSVKPDKEKPTSQANSSSVGNPNQNSSNFNRNQPADKKQRVN